MSVSIDTLKGLGAKFYLIVDDHNERKAHHIAVIEGIHDAIEIFYNQALDYSMDPERRARLEANGVECQADGFYDIREWDRVLTGEFHGYRKYIDAALGMHRKAQAAKREVERQAAGPNAGHYLEVFRNQGWREGIVLATREGAFLVAYVMPRGMVSLVECVYDDSEGAWGELMGFKQWRVKRSLARKSLPGYWRTAMDFQGSGTWEDVLEDADMELECFVD